MPVNHSEAVPFAAGVVGSLPRPRAVIDMLPDTPGAESADASRSPQMDAAVACAIALQETAGLDLVSDGEWRRYRNPRFVHFLRFSDTHTGDK